MITLLKIEIDGHFHGGEPVKPWVAEIMGPCPLYGLKRNFIEPKNDWSQARSAWSGNVYGRVAHFPLREGKIYEVQRCRGNSSKRRVVREFVEVSNLKIGTIEPEIVLERLDRKSDAIMYRLPEPNGSCTRVARVTGLGMPEALGWIKQNETRIYRLRTGVYEIVDRDVRSICLVLENQIRPVSEAEAWQWIQINVRSEKTF